MSRTLLLGALGLVLAVATGLAVHLLTRETIALPVVRLEQDAGLAPAPTTTATIHRRTSTERVTTTAPATTRPPATPAPAATPTDDETETEAETEDNSGSGSDGSGQGRGRGRGGGSDD